jgi:hypothetical protein
MLFNSLSFYIFRIYGYFILYYGLLMFYNSLPVQFKHNTNNISGLKLKTQDSELRTSYICSP